MVNAQEVIARALELSEAATDGPWGVTVDASRTGVEHGVWSEAASGYAAEFVPDMPDAEFIAAARTLLPALAKALGDVLAIVEESESRGGPYRELLHTTQIRAAFDALSEVTP